MSSSVGSSGAIGCNWQIRLNTTKTLLETSRGKAVVLACVSFFRLKILAIFDILRRVKLPIK